MSTYKCPECGSRDLEIGVPQIVYYWYTNDNLKEPHDMSWSGQALKEDIALICNEGPWSWAGDKGKAFGYRLEGVPRQR